MHKSKLQELCQRESWELPEYATAKDGPDHMPRFTATATVCGQVFETPAHCKSSKEAQNTAARVAFDSLSAPPPPPPSSAPSPPPSSAPSPPHLAACSDAPLCVAEPPRIQPLSITPYPPPLPLSPFPSSLPDPPPALLATKCNADTKPVKEELLLKEEILQENADDQSQCSIDYKIATGSVSKGANMYKSKLQELCQRESWELPEYATAKDGPNHMLRFTATITVCGQVFETPAHCKSSKEAQNTAARVAFDSLSVPPPPSAAPSPPTIAACSDVPLHVAEPPRIQPLSITPDPPPLPLSPFPSSLPDPPPALLATKCNADTKPVKEELLLKEELMPENADDQSQCSIDYKIATGSGSKDILHMYKNLLQQHAQKENIGFPVYTSEAEGPPHARRFKSKVSLNGKYYETSEFFTTLKEAEQTAARIACQALSVGVIQEDKGLYKNLLQELVQKRGLKCPSYDTVSSGLSHKPVFVSTVEIGTESFKGVEAKTRKQAEMNAAEVAYCTLTKGCSPMNSSKVSFANNFSQDIKPTVTSQKHQTTTDGEDHLLAKRAKSLPENMDVNAHQAKSSPENMDVNAHQSNPPSQDSNLENSISVQPVPDPTVENNPLIKSKTVVFPRKLNWPIPENATVMPYSDEKWVAYRLELDQNPTS